MRHVQGLFEHYKSYVSERDGEDATVEAAVVLAHPDDEIVISALIAAVHGFNAAYKKPAIRMHGITLSLGENTTKNYRAHEEFDPKLGHRAPEAKAGAEKAGFVSHAQLEGTDGKLAKDVPWQVEKVSKLLVEGNVDLVLSITKMSQYDSSDHQVAGTVAYVSAEKAAQETNKDMGVLLVQPGNRRGLWAAESNARSLAIVRDVAVANRSQFQVEHIDDQPDWIEFSDNHAMDPEDWDALRQYQLEGIATHTYAAVGQLLVPQLVAV